MVRRRGRARGAAVLCALVATGCATKGDVRDLQQEMAQLARQQETVLRETEQQTALLLDTLRQGFNVQRDLRGETSHRFQQLEENLSRLEEMITQTQLVVAQLLERLDRPVSSGMPLTGPGGEPVVPGAAEGLYEQAQGFLQQQSYATARMAFEQILRDFPNDPRAPDAQFGLAETYAGEGEAERAIEELLKVEEQWPRSTRAPQALLRAGIIAKDNGMTDRARELLRQVGERYPTAPEARVAEQQLRTIR